MGRAATFFRTMARRVIMVEKKTKPAPAKKYPSWLKDRGEKNPLSTEAGPPRVEGEVVDWEEGPASFAMVPSGLWASMEARGEQSATGPEKKGGLECQGER